MIGNAMLRVLSESPDWNVIGSVRDEGDKAYFAESIAARMVAGVDLVAEDDLVRLFNTAQPDVVVNCAGLTKHVPAGRQSLTAILMNALLPHRLAELCGVAGARLIHVSTDCVFSGVKGNRKEADPVDAQDVYGRSKVLGEVSGSALVTLRTSTIGHELHTKHGLLEWFLSQARCKGFTRAIFSGVPSVLFARVVRDIVIPNTQLSGLYHVAAEPIAKADLLKLIAEIYRVDIEILPDDSLVIDRSLDASRFGEATGYRAPAWPEMIAAMYDYHRKESNRHV
jgi:dTDP-4-dehydrorhamnose reductase